MVEGATHQNLSQFSASSFLHSDSDIEKQDQPDVKETIAAAVGKQEEDEPEWKPQKHEWLVMLTLSTISLMVALDATILVPVLTTIAFDLHGTANDALWTGTSYLLTSAVFQPFIAALSDIFGRREFLFPALILFTIGTAVCCAANNFTTLLAGRCVQGVGGGGIITLSQVIFADITPLRQRPKYFAVILGAWALGSVLGPLIGGLFVEKDTWRWCFYINFPLCALGLPMVLFLIPLKTVKTSLKVKFLRVDWLGGFLFISGLTSFLIAISWGGIQFSWYSWRTLVPLIVGLTAMAISFVWEGYGATEPFLRHSLFSSVSAYAAYFCALLQGLLLFTALYYFPFFLTSTLNKSPIASGLDIFPATCLLLPGSVIVSVLITRIGKFRIFAWLGWSAATLGAGLLVHLTHHTKTTYWAPSIAIFGAGMGMILSSINFATQANARVQDIGRAAAMYTFMRSLGMAIGIAISGSVFQNLMSKKLVELGLDSSIAKNAESYVAILRKLEVTNPAAAANVITAYERGFCGVWAVITSLCGLGLGISLFLRHCVLDKKINSQYKLDRKNRNTKLTYGTAVSEINGMDRVIKTPDCVESVAAAPSQRGLLSHSAVQEGDGDDRESQHFATDRTSKETSTVATSDQRQGASSESSRSPYLTLSLPNVVIG